LAEAVRALDGHSERSIRDVAGDKSAGQQLSREADKLIREQHDGKAENTSKVLGNNSRDVVNLKIDMQSRDTQESAQKRDVQKAEQNRDVQKAEQNRDAQRAERLTPEQRAEQRLVEQQKILQRTEQRAAEQRTQRTEQQQIERQKVEQPKSDDSSDSTKFKPSLLDGRNWQKDGSGNFVTRANDGRLLTTNGDGKLVDYQSHMSQKHMQSQDQMALTSILFCNPLMLLGMGAAFAVMDQAHGAKTGKMTEALNKKFDGKQANAKAMQSGYASDLQAKAQLIQQYTRPMETREVTQMNGIAGMSSAAAAEREELKKRSERKKSLEATAKRQETKISMPADRYNMSTKKLMKTKRLLEDEIEKVRGKASLEEVSRLYAQVEVLDKALKRLANF